MTSPEKNGVKTSERLIWFDYQEQCGESQVTASAHIGHRRRTEKDEGQKKVASQTGTGTETGQPRTYQKENQTTVTQLHEKSAQTNYHHGTELKAAKPDK